MIAYDALNGAMKDSSGAIIKARDQISGIRADIMKGLTSSGASSLNISTADMDFYRFSGNDITKLKYQELKDFAETGYPIIFDDKLLDPNDNRFIDNRLVDDSSICTGF